MADERERDNRSLPCEDMLVEIATPDPKFVQHEPHLRPFFRCENRGYDAARSRDAWRAPRDSVPALVRRSQLSARDVHETRQQRRHGLMTQRLEIVRLLVAAQADVDHQDAHGDNVLHWCARDSHVVLLSFFLNETEASVNATFAENYKRDKPLDIEKRQLSRAPSMTTTTAFNLLRHVDRKCNIRMKMQALKRYHTAQQSSIDVRESETLQTALDTTNAALKRVEHVWTHAIQQAEANRQHAEDTHVASAVAAASRAAVDWFNTKDGKAHAKKQLTDATADIKRDVQTGKLVKPKDLKVAAVERVQDTYRREQEAATRRAAIERFHVKTALPTYPLDATPATLAAALCLLHTS
ncbi:hypothetical protein FI667_g12130, partial [Globisporangium splendens]